MSPVPLECMIVEVLKQICEYLDSKTLSAFALVSKQCNSVANVLLFRKIHITVLSRKKLQLDVDRWSRTLEHACSLKYVRQLEIEGHMPDEQDDTGKLEATIPAYLQNVEQDCNSQDDLSTWDEEGDPWGFGDDKVPYVTIQDDDAWKPLANFIRQLPTLADLVYACTNQFSPCLLEVLHRHYPECRLHMRTFNFRSLHQQDTDPYEFALATSPCLYSISVHYMRLDSDGNGAYNEEATLRTVSGLAPNLKDVRMFRVRAASSHALKNAIASGIRQPWQGFSLDTCKTDLRPAKLARLELHGNGLITQPLLDTWNNHIDFSTLRIIKLGYTVADKALSWAAANYTFHSLTTLYLVVNLEWNRTQDTDEYHILLDSFLRSLPSLRNLRVIGWLRQNTFDAIIEHHGKSLRRLWLETDREINRFVFNSYQVEKIRQHCPMLEDLMLNPIPRSKGDAQEVAIYKTLGAVSKLQRLTLTLNTSNVSLIQEGEDIPEDPSFDEFHQQFQVIPSYRDSYNYQLRYGHVRDALINSALDETLARAIFNCISSRKAHDAFPLEYLKLSSSGGSVFGRVSSMGLPGLRQVVLNISRTWLLVRSARDDCRDTVIARELGRRAREANEASNTHPSYHAAWLDVEPVFRRIWPERQDSSGDWRDDWYSWPLSDS
jgi:hypothetical protein